MWNFHLILDLILGRASGGAKSGISVARITGAEIRQYSTGCRDQGTMMKERILVEEAEEQIRNEIVTILESANSYCLKAANSSEALAFFQSGEEFDLMLAASHQQRNATRS